MSNEDELSGQFLLHVRHSTTPRRIKSYGFYTSPSNLLRSRKPRSRPTQPADQLSQDDLKLIGTLQSADRIMGYALSGQAVARATFDLPDQRVSAFLNRGIEKSATRVRQRPTSQLFLTKSLDIGEIEEQFSQLKFAKSHSYAIRQAIFSGVVSTFDTVLADLIRLILEVNPRVITEMKQAISFEDVLEASDFKLLQDRLIGKVVRSLGAEVRAEQIKWLEKHGGLADFKSQLSCYSSFIEVCERRNLFVHSDGIVNDDYLKRVKIAGHKPEAKVGERLPVTQRYFAASADALLEAYVLISQSSVRKLGKNASEEAKEQFDAAFSNVGYEQISRGRYQSAIRISEMIRSSKFEIKDATIRSAIVNEAIAYGKLGKQDDQERILNSVDWTSAKNEFVICIRAIRGDVEGVCKLIPQLHGSEWIDVPAYFSWHAFDNVRKRPEFWSKLQEVYGDEIKVEMSGDTEEKLAD